MGKGDAVVDHNYTQEFPLLLCEEQTARLAQLTLLVGENSTSKTSFLAMTCALGDVAQ